MISVIRRIRDWNPHWQRFVSEGLSVGLVPTMGALHGGHLALIRAARKANDIVVVSIFVNPTQFDDPTDLKRYPKSWDHDRVVAEGAGADFIFSPAGEAMYPDGYAYRVSESRRSGTMEGEHRPGHFDGVLTVVLKLLNIIRPSRAYFGEKDYQQLRLVQGMVQALFMDVEIVSVATVREPDGLALSSRNALLTRKGRSLAAAFPRYLREMPSADEARARLISEGFEVEYVEETKGRRFGAVVIDDVRLIDNVPLPLDFSPSPQSPISAS